MYSTSPLDQIPCVVFPNERELCLERGRPQPVLPEVVRSLPASLRKVTPCRSPVARSWLTALGACFNTDAHVALYRTDQPNWQRFHPRLSERSRELLDQQGIHILLQVLAIDLHRTDALAWGRSRTDDERLELQLEWLQREHGAYIFATPFGARALSALPKPLDIATWTTRTDAWLTHLRKHLTHLEPHAPLWDTLLRLPRIRREHSGVLQDLQPLLEYTTHHTLVWPPNDVPVPTPPSESSPAKSARERLAPTLPPHPEKPPLQEPEPHRQPAPPDEPGDAHALWAERLRAMYQSGALSSPRFVKAMCRLTALETGLDLANDLEWVKPSRK